MTISFADQLISKGLKREDVSKALADMSSYYNRLNTLGGEIASCKACPLRAGCKRPITGLGPLRPEIVVVSDHPFPDKDGNHRLMETMTFMMIFFSKLGIAMEDIYWTHAVKCPTERVKMLHIKECHRHLAKEMMVLKPAVIVALGSVAISSLACEYIPIDEAIGGEFYYTVHNQDVPVIPVYHPRQMMEDDGGFREKFSRNWKSLMEVVDYL